MTLAEESRGSLLAKLRHLFRWRRDQQWAGYFFLLPSFVGLLVFTVLPVITSLGISFLDWDLLSALEFVGLENYRKLFTEDLIFEEVAGNTVIFVIGIVPLQTLISLGLAALLVQPLRGMGVFRVIYYLPVITTIVAVALIFRWMFDRNYGVISGLIWQLGDLLQIPLRPPDWLNSTSWAKVTVILLTLWKNIGFTTLIFMAGLQSIPHSLYEAAAIDGAGKWRRFRHITLPMISPTTFFVVVILTIGAFQLFGESFILTEGGPGYATTTIVQYIYQSAFDYFRMGKGAAISWVLFAVIFALTLVQFGIQRKWVHYETGEE